MQRKRESYGRLPPTLNSKGQGHPLICLCTDRREAEAQLQPFVASALEGEGCPASRPGHFYTGKGPGWVSVGAGLDGHGKSRPPRTVQAVSSHHTDYVILVATLNSSF